MSTLPAKELLEATHQFPCKYTFKVIGKAEGEFVERVVALVRGALRQDFDPPYELRHTAHGRHVSVSLEPVVENADEVLQVYEHVRGVEGLVMIW